MIWRRSLVAIVAVTGLVIPRPALAAPVACDDWDPFTAELVQEIESAYPSRNFTAAVVDLDRDCAFHLHPGQVQSTASVIKISIMASALLRAQDQGRALTAGERSLIEPMISRSDDPSASSLWVSLGGATGIRATLDRFGLTETTPREPKWGASLTTARDQVDLLAQLLLGDGPLAEPGRAEARGFMDNVVESQQWGATAGLPDEWPVPMKNGFFDSIGWDWRINTVGYVDPPDRDGYLLAVLTDGWPAEAPGIVGIEVVTLAINSRLNRQSPPAHPFIDVGEGAHYEGALVGYVATGVIEGRSPVFFDPHGAMTRAQFASVLHRVAGSPVADAESLPFDDVHPDATHAEAITWLAGQDITAGITATEFGPNRSITRAQVAVMLHRRAGSPSPSGASPFADVPFGSAHHDAVTWMAESGITNGITEGWFGATEPVTRGQVISLLDRADVGP